MLLGNTSLSHVLILLKSLLRLVIMQILRSLKTLPRNLCNDLARLATSSNVAVRSCNILQRRCNVVLCQCSSVLWSQTCVVWAQCSAATEHCFVVASKTILHGHRKNQEAKPLQGFEVASLKGQRLC